MEERTLKIYYTEFDEAGNEIGKGVYHKEYKCWGWADRIAQKLYGDRKRFKVVIAPRDPSVQYFRTVRCDVCGKEYTVEENAHGLVRATDHYVYINNREDPDIRIHYMCSECFGKLCDLISEIRKEKE